MHLNHWSAGNIERIYVSGLEGTTGKTWVSMVRGNVSLSAEALDAPAPVLLNRLLAAVGIDPAIKGAALFALLKSQALSSAKPRGSGGRAKAAGAPIRPGFASPLPPRASGRDLAFDNIINALPVEIEVDHREPDAFVDLLSRVKNLTATRTTLQLGDFRINGGKVLVERKTVRDLALSIQDGRVFDQAQRIGFEPGAAGIVIIEGDPFREETGMLASAVTGAITCLSMVQGMSVICTLDMEHTAYVVAKLAQHERNGLGYELPSRRDKQTQLLNAQHYLLEGINGISANLAAVLLQQFGSVRAIGNASEADLRAVRGIGPKTAKRIVEIFGVRA
ncbi:MAG: ERCC4 domain-containing protein [Pseudomonas sp.]